MMAGHFQDSRKVQVLDVSASGLKNCMLNSRWLTPPAKILSASGLSGPFRPEADTALAGGQQVPELRQPVRFWTNGLFYGGQAVILSRSSSFPAVLLGVQARFEHRS
jgi:hypothetical protein